MIPELPSEPPQFVARISSETGCGVRRASLATGSRSWTALIPRLDGLADPARLLDVTRNGALRVPGAAMRCSIDQDPVWFTSQPSPIRT